VTRANGATPGKHYEQLVRRQRAELQDAYMKGVRRLRWDAGRLAAERERRLRELLVYAAERSPFWRERLAGHDLANFTEADLPSLPILTKAEMMAEFDRVLTVPGLTRERVQQHVDSLDGDRYLDDEYRAIVTSGYAGMEALHVYGWDAFVTFVMQGSRWTGRRGEPPDAVLAQCFSCSARHESGAFYAFSSFEGGGPTSHCFDATLPLDEIVDRLNNIRPSVQALQGWPSLIWELAQEAKQGRLTIKPTWVSVAGELCTKPVREAVRSAWGIEASEFWGCSEGTYAFPCGVGEGMHVADDLVILEPADADGNVVPYGKPADRMLLTNLFNLAQPLIRYDLVDAVTMSDEPCPCGCAHRRIISVNGRINGVFEYEGGATVPRAAFEQTVVATPGVANFFIGQTPGGVDVSVVTDGSSDLQQLRKKLIDVLRRHGGPESDVAVREVGSIDRLSRGKCRQFDTEAI
jgi:phenylacetate-coenzyme A ligase PaaK-like adenylate-forming protein